MSSYFSINAVQERTNELSLVHLGVNFPRLSYFVHTEVVLQKNRSEILDMIEHPRKLKACMREALIALPSERAGGDGTDVPGVRMIDWRPLRSPGGARGRISGQGRPPDRRAPQNRDVPGARGS